MSVAVALDELARRVQEFGPHAFLVTTGADDARPHVVSVAVTFDGTAFSLSAGRTSSANVGGRPNATLLWPGTGGPYSLIVDGQARFVDDVIVVEPTRAVLHRLAGAPDDLPSCVRIEPDA
jgi:hypothetical protein